MRDGRSYSRQLIAVRRRAVDPRFQALRSSARTPEAISASYQRGLRPRPLHVSLGFSGLRDLMVAGTRFRVPVVCIRSAPRAQIPCFWHALQEQVSFQLSSESRNFDGRTSPQDFASVRITLSGRSTAWANSLMGIDVNTRTCR